MANEQPENTIPFVTPVRIGSAISRDQGVVLLTIAYKVSPDDPEEFQLRLALEREHSEAFLAALRESMLALWGR